jgi:hypothetical protein
MIAGQIIELMDSLPPHLIWIFKKSINTLEAFFIKIRSFLLDSYLSLGSTQIKCGGLPNKRKDFLLFLLVKYLICP